MQTCKSIASIQASEPTASRLDSKRFAMQGPNSRRAHRQSQSRLNKATLGLKPPSALIHMANARGLMDAFFAFWDKAKVFNGVCQVKRIAR